MYQVRKGCLGLSCSLACPKMQNFTQFLLHWALVSQKMTTSLSISTQTHPFPFPDPSHPAPQGPQVLKPPHILGSSPRKVFLSPGSVWVLILWPAGSPHHWKTRVFSFLLWPLSGPLWSRALLCPQCLALPSCPLPCCLHEGQKEELPLPCFSQPFSHSPHSGCHPRFLCSDASCLSDHLPHPSCYSFPFLQVCAGCTIPLTGPSPFSPPSLSTHPRSSSVPCGADSNRTAFRKARGVLLVWWLFLFSLARIRTEYSCRSVLRRS